MTAFDTVLRGGTIVDGTGARPFRGDVAIDGGRIAQVGRVDGKGGEEIDAGGLLVTPGFVDIHTHYDGLATWGQRLTPSSWHGVTTVVTGNCGVGFAPCRPEDRELLIRVMEGVEDIPGLVLKEGLPWTWQSFPEFLDVLDQGRFDSDIAAQVPHGPIRIHAMGLRGAAREPATGQDIARMQALVEEALEAGALGFSTARTMIHRLRDGSLAPTITAGEEELRGIAQAMRRVDKGVLQMVSDYSGVEPKDVGELKMWRRLVEESGRSLSFNLTQTTSAPERWRAVLEFIEKANDDGVTMKGQVCNRPIGLLFGLQCSYNPFSGCPTFKAVAGRPLAETVAILRQPEIRARLIEEVPNDPNKVLLGWMRSFDAMYALGEKPNYLPDPEASLGARARQLGRPVIEHAYDLMLENDGTTIFYFPVANYAHRNSQAIEAQLAHPHTVPGIGDGGAHIGMICDSSLTTHLLTHWTRDREDGPRIPIEIAVKALTRDTAATVGLDDRGMLVPGCKADINLIDYDRLAIPSPEPVHDLPAGGLRLVQRAKGYVATMVAGTVTYRNGIATEALPGRLVRGKRARPTAVT